MNLHLVALHNFIVLNFTTRPLTLSIVDPEKILIFAMWSLGVAAMEGLQISVMLGCAGGEGWWGARGARLGPI